MLCYHQNHFHHYRCSVFKYKCCINIRISVAFMDFCFQISVILLFGTIVIFIIIIFVIFIIIITHQNQCRNSYPQWMGWVLWTVLFCIGKHEAFGEANHIALILTKKKFFFSFLLRSCSFCSADGDQIAVTKHWNRVTVNLYVLQFHASCWIKEIVWPLLEFSM